MLYVVRHGQTVWNVEGRYQGHRDSALTELGQRQARAVAAHLRDVGIAQIFASPLGRAWTTAGILAEATRLPPSPDDRLKEFGYGACEGLTLAEIEATFPGKPAWRDADKWNRRYPGAECYADLFARARSFAEDHLAGLLDDGRATAACVVAHDAINRSLVGFLMDWGPEEIMSRRQANNAVFILQGRDLQVVEVSVD